MRYWASIIGRLHARRLVCLLVLGALLAAHVPIPITLPPPGKEQAVRYPCENNPCGCLSAEQCWRSCCCRTNAEKLVWARANGVTPPEIVMAAAKEEAAGEAESSRSCCSQRAECCSRDSSAASRCETAAASPSRSSHEEDDVHEEGDAKFIIGIAAQRCRGLSSHWLNLPWMIVADDAPTRTTVFVAPMSEIEGCPTPEVDDSPPTPPPRIARHAC